MGNHFEVLGAEITCEPVAAISRYEHVFEIRVLGEFFVDLLLNFLLGLFVQVFPVLILSEVFFLIEIVVAEVLPPSEESELLKQYLLRSHQASAIHLQAATVSGVQTAATTAITSIGLFLSAFTVASEAPSPHH